MSHSSAAAAVGSGAPTVAAPKRALISWALFDWSAQPFYTLITTFLFAPFFATAVMGNATEGQKIWGYAAAVAGVFIAIGSPFLGALADGRGRRKPWIALFAATFALGMSCLWLAVPGASTGTIALVLAAFVAAAVSAEYCQVFTNAIMPTLVPHSPTVPVYRGRLARIGPTIISRTPSKCAIMS